MGNTFRIEQLAGGLIVSCQAFPGEALFGSEMMVKMALSAKAGGAIAIRTNSPEDIEAIKQAVQLPVIGLWKRDYIDSDVYITPTLSDVRQVIAAGADIVAMDATLRVRPEGEDLAQIVKQIKAESNCLMMADVSTVEEGLHAEAIGFDVVSSTLSGYTPYSPQLPGPDFALLKELAACLRIPVFAEGRIQSPEQAYHCMECGAFAVVVGTAITRPQIVTKQYTDRLQQAMVNNELKQHKTESRNERSANLDQMSTKEILFTMNTEDQRVPMVIASHLEQIAAVVDQAAERLRGGGVLFYVGAGTSGRLAVLDAYECPPTFGTSPELVQAVLAGGEKAAEGASEEAEDDREQGAEDLRKRLLQSTDVVIGIAASGTTPYVCGALQYASEAGALTVAISCNRNSEIGKLAELPIEIEVGPEVLTGSTRLKAGTAQKMVLNMISTAVMVKLGKVYGNLMVDVQPSNAKLRERAIRIIHQATGISLEEAARAYEDSGKQVKTSIVMIEKGVDRLHADELLERANGLVRNALLLN